MQSLAPGAPPRRKDVDEEHLEDVMMAQSQRFDEDIMKGNDLRTPNPIKTMKID